MVAQTGPVDRGMLIAKTCALEVSKKWTDFGFSQFMTLYGELYLHKCVWCVCMNKCVCGCIIIDKVNYKIQKEK